jgi:hypothetical protein
MRELALGCGSAGEVCGEYGASQAAAKCSNCETGLKPGLSSAKIDKMKVE